LVTGAANGIGRAVAEALADEGASVVVQDIDPLGAEQVVDGITGRGGKAAASSGDVTRPADTDAMVEVARSLFGGVDIVVCNAATIRPARIHEMTDDEWLKVIDVALNGAFNTVRSAASFLMRQAGEISYHRKVISMSSTSGVHGGGVGVNYSAAKAGIVGFSKGLAREWAAQKINVNVIAPGGIAGTRRLRGSDEAPPPPDGEEWDRLFPIGRAGRVADIAAIAVFLAGSGSDYITGQVIEANGGTTIIPPRPQARA
jgi:3-oxoacyl-[acyl-carrier protein] reductase